VGGQIGNGSEVDWPAGTIGGNGNEGVAAETQQQPGAVGYLSIAYAIENDISMASVVNADGNAIYPTVESVAAGPGDHHRHHPRRLPLRHPRRRR
jgi:phosphate transport system substrate-binding protein